MYTKTPQQSSPSAHQPIARSGTAKGMRTPRAMPVRTTTTRVRYMVSPGELFGNESIIREATLKTWVSSIFTFRNMLYKQQVDWPACLVRSPQTIQYEAVVLRYAPDFKDPWALRSTHIAKLLPSNKGSKIRNRSNMIQFQPKFPRSCCDEDPTNQVLSYRKFTLRSWTMSTMLLFAYNLCFKTRT